MRRGPSPSPSPPPVSQRSGGQHASSACTEGTRKRPATGRVIAKSVPHEPPAADGEPSPPLRRTHPRAGSTRLAAGAAREEGSGRRPRRRHSRRRRACSGKQTSVAAAQAVADRQHASIARTEIGRSSAIAIAAAYQAAAEQTAREACVHRGSGEAAVAGGAIVAVIAAEQPGARQLRASQHRRREGSGQACSAPAVRATRE